MCEPVLLHLASLRSQILPIGAAAGFFFLFLLLMFCGIFFRYNKAMLYTTFGECVVQIKT